MSKKDIRNQLIAMVCIGYFFVLQHYHITEGIWGFIKYLCLVYSIIIPLLGFRDLKQKMLSGIGILAIYALGMIQYQWFLIAVYGLTFILGLDITYTLMKFLGYMK